MYAEILLIMKQVFHSGILLILVTHKMSSFSYWNFDSSLIGQSFFNAGNLLILAIYKTRILFSCLTVTDLSCS